MPNSALLVLGVLAAAAAALVAITAARHTAARRLGIRSARRRPTETALVTLGALLGTAIITGSLVVGDALESSMQAGAFTQLGPVDETVTAPTAYQLITNAGAFGGLDVRFQVPWLQIAVLLGVTLLASTAAAAWPAHQASRIRPAAALRTLE